MKVVDEAGWHHDDAWRYAVETWLQYNGFITVRNNKKVLPHLNEQWAHNYSAMVMFAPYDADRDYSEEERVEHSVVVAGVEVAIRKKTKRGHP